MRKENFQGMALFPVVLAILLAAIILFSYQFQSGTAQVDIHAANETETIIAEVAGSQASHEKGLMNRKSMPNGSGMLFVFNDEAPRSFWMKNTLIPLDIIFVSSNYTIVDMKEGFMPCESDPCPAYSSVAPAKFVIEVNAGFVKSHGIEMGNEVFFKSCPITAARRA